MKRLFAAAALAAAAVVPASPAAAIPPTTSGGPLGSAACVVVATPALPGTCNFTGAANGLGFIGGSSEGFTLTHVKKVNVCAVDPADGKNKVTGYAAEVVTDASSEDSSFSGYDFEAGPGYNFVGGRVYTFTVNGFGWGAVGGPSSPTPTAPSEPATPSAANNYAGAEDTSKAIGAVC